MSYHSRRLPSRKRKEMDVFHSSTSPKPLIPPTAVSRAVTYTKSTPTTSSKVAAEPQQPLCSNRLLAGYMAYEFLTKGTLFGQKFDPARAEAAPVRNKQSQFQSQLPSAQAEPSLKSKPKPETYAEVANLLKGDEAYIPGVVNPTQLARWINQM